jgi:poly [ADP-ribose] polymerase
MDMLREKLGMVQSLADIEIASTLITQSKLDYSEMHPLDAYYTSLHNQLSPLDPDSEKWQLLELYLQNTHAPSHSDYGLELVNVYEVERVGERDRFVQGGFHELDNQMLLWHGSRLSNWASILSQGLRIAPPEAPVTGYMYNRRGLFSDLKLTFEFVAGSERVSTLVTCAASRQTTALPRETCRLVCLLCVRWHLAP